MFKISSKNSKRLWRNRVYKIWFKFGAKNVCFSSKKIPQIFVTEIKCTKAQLHNPNDLSPRSYSETAFARCDLNCGQKCMFFSQKNT